MLDLRNPVPLPELPDVIVYRDDGEPARFYALPRRPRFAVDETGVPLVKLLVYGQGDGADFQAVGGIVSLTVAMQLTPEEERQVLASLSTELAGRGPAAGAPSPELAGINWLDGDVTVTIVPEMNLVGKPSLFAANACALSANLDAVTVRRVLGAWTEGLPDGFVNYRLATRARVGTPHGSSSAPATVQLNFDGPLNSRGDDLARLVSTVHA